MSDGAPHQRDQKSVEKWIEQPLKLFWKFMVVAIKPVQDLGYFNWPGVLWELAVC